MNFSNHSSTDVVVAVVVEDVDGDLTFSI